MSDNDRFEGPSRSIERLQGALERYRLLSESPRIRRIGWLVAGAVFAIAALLAFGALPDGLEIHVPLLVLALATVPIVTLLTGMEVRFVGLMAGVSFDLRTAVRITLAGAIANLTPVPGSAAVRLGSILARGGKLRRGTTSSIAVGLVWVGVALAGGGVAVIAATDRLWAVVLTASGLAAVGFGIVIMISGLRAGWKTGVKVIAVEVGIVLISSVRTFILIVALGYSGTLAQGWLVTMSGVIATAAGFFPGGLGLYELLAAATANLTGLSSSIAVVVAIADRLVRLSGLAIISAAVRKPLVSSEGSHPDDHPGYWDG